MSIQTRLLLLVLAVWLPAAAGFGLLARDTYLREAAAARQNMQQLAQSVSLVVERELDKRAVMARTLAASAALRDNDLRRFHQEAGAAVKDSGSWAILVTPDQQVLNTLVDFDRMRPLPRPPGVSWVTADTEVIYYRRVPVGRRPVVGVFSPELGISPARYNVGIAFEPSVIQAIVDKHEFPEGSVAAVINRSQLVMARSRNPERWLGKQATGDLQRRAQDRQTGFGESVTLDGVPSITYLTPSNRHGWSVVIAFPKSALTISAQRATASALGAAGILLLIGLVVAMHAARGISRPVLALRKAAADLGQDAVPPRLSTGVTEADDVARALHEAGLRSQEAKHTLERRVAEAVDEAEHAQARLLEARKHEAIGRLTGGLAHDFNNLLQTINSALHMMNRHTQGLEGPQQRVVQAAMRACAKAAELVRQMLAFGRAQALKPQPVDLQDFVLKSRELTTRALGEQLRLTAAITPGLPAVHVDAMQLELALLNLVFNARDAMPRGGHIRIVGRRLADGEAPELQGRDLVCVEVVDDGPGMDADTCRQAFEPYFTTKPVGAGSGLGLAQVLAFARQSGGDARIDSGPGQGTRVSLYLPASSVRPQRTQSEPRPQGVQRALKVLMVEDDLLVSSVVVAALEGAGHAVHLCATAAEAVQVLAGGGDFDVLFTDVVMPGEMNGLDLVAWCREHRPGLRAVVATGYTTQQPQPDIHVLHKPYEIDVLLDALQPP